jgi:hypothetical protein
MMRLAVVALLLVGCSAPERRDDCEIQIHNHPTLPRPAGRLKAHCDGKDRMVIDAKRVRDARCGTTK